MLIGNKSDIEERKVSWKDIEKFTTKNNSSYFQASSYSNLNYEMILARIIEDMTLTMENSI